MKVAFALIIALQDAGAPFAREGKPVCDAFVYSEIPAARSGSSRMRRAVDLRRSGVKHLIDTRSWPPSGHRAPSMLRRYDIVRASERAAATRDGARRRLAWMNKWR